MDVRFRVSWLVAVVMALTAHSPAYSQTLKPSAARQPYIGPFSVSRGVDVSGGVSGLTPAAPIAPIVSVPVMASGFELIRIMPMSWNEAVRSGAGAAARKTYALGDLGDNPELGAWIVDMIPKVVHPGTWNNDGTNSRVLSYFAPAKMLLVYHTPAAHAEIEEFLQSVKKALPQSRPVAASSPAHLHQGVTQAQHIAAEPRLAPGAPASRGIEAYPVPAQSRQPRHLFHFIIRYEGDGVIDSNIVEFAKAYGRDNSSSEEKSSSGGEATIPPAAETTAVKKTSAPAVPMPVAVPPHSGPISFTPYPPAAVAPTAPRNVVVPVSCAGSPRPIVPPPSHPQNTFLDW